MEIMLPAADDNGARLAAILPTGLGAVARTLGVDSRIRGTDTALENVPPLRSFVLIVVDGLGEANLKARAGHARTLAGLQRKRLSTVIPSTTAAALTSLVTGELPGQHGLIGYRIRHPRLGILSPLKDWEGITVADAWQRSTPLFEVASSLGIRSYAIGRPAHATGGLTAAILRGAEYLGGQRIADRFALAREALSAGDPSVMYLYVDELDKAGHEFGWESERWLRRLEQLDAAVDDFLRYLPADVGVVITADHGMVDVADHQQVILDEAAWFDDRISDVAGEPRMRSLYLNDPADAARVAHAVQEAEGTRAWVGTRDQAIAAGWYGPTESEVSARLGDVLIAARKQVAYYLSTDSEAARAMVGQHGSLSSEERGIPLALAGQLAGSGFAAAVARVATSRFSPLSSG